MHLLKKLFLLLLTASVLCGSFPNTAKASNMPDELTEAVQPDLMLPEETKDSTDSPGDESAGIAETSTITSEISDTYTVTAPAESEHLIPSSDKEIQTAISDLPETTTDEELPYEEE